MEKSNQKIKTRIMKKTLLFTLISIISLLGSSKLSAQTDITFCVNLDCFSSVTAPTVFGSFNGWNAGANPITDPDGDGTYCGIVNLPDGQHEYKFFFQEEGAEDMDPTEDAACTLTTGAFTNRVLTVAGASFTENFGWESCDLTCTGPPATTDVTLCVDLTCFSSVNAASVFGAFNGWNAGANPVSDPDGDGIYCATVGMIPGDQEYKFFFAEEGPEDMDPTEDAACTLTTGAFTNRVITVGTTALSETYGWESCDLTCTAPPALPSPATAAPSPTDPQASVISMFSNVYTDVPVDTWLTPWSAGTLTDIQIDGNDTKLYESLNFVGVETVGPNLLDVSGMDDINIDIWTPNLTELRIKLVDFGADEAFGGGDDSEHEITFTAPALETWITYTIPLSSFTGLNSTTDIAQLILSGNPSGSGVLYVDNVYYSTVAPLPAELTSFTATPVQNKINLEWTTATEINNDFFQIERSADGRNFKPLSLIPGFGNSTTRQTYEFLDQAPLAGINYYRLTQVDFDGTETKSEIISARVETFENAFELTSKAVNGNEVSLTYQVPSSGTYHMTIFDVSGKILHTEKADLTQGLNEMVTSIPGNGIFIVTLSDQQNTVVEKIFK